MRILFDHCVPKPLRRHLKGHSIRTAREMQWEALQNGNLLDAAQNTFDVLLTIDKNMAHQQKIAGRPLALLILDVPDNRIETIQPLVPDVLALLPTMQPGQIYRAGAQMESDHAVE